MIQRYKVFIPEWSTEVEANSHEEAYEIGAHKYDESKLMFPGELGEIVTELVDITKKKNNCICSGCGNEHDSGN